MECFFKTENLHRYNTQSLGGNAWQGETWKKFGSQERLLHSTFGIIQMRGLVMSQIDTALGHTAKTDLGYPNLSQSPKNPFRVIHISVGKYFKIDHEMFSNYIY